MSAETLLLKDFLWKGRFSDLKNTLNKVWKAIDTVNERTGVIISLLFFPGWFLVLYSVVVRYFFNAPSNWAGDLAKFLFAIYFMMGGAYCLMNNYHIRVDVIYNLFSYKIRRLIELVVVIPLLFAFAFPLVWQGSAFAWKSVEVWTILNEFTCFPRQIRHPYGGGLFLLRRWRTCIASALSRMPGRKPGNEH